MGDFCRSEVTTLYREGNKERRSYISREEKRGLEEEEEEENKSALGPEAVFLPRGLVNVLLYPLDQYITILALLISTPI